MVVAVVAMLVAANPLANFINANPAIVMLALGFLLMIGMALIAEGFGRAMCPKAISTPRWHSLRWSRGSTCSIAALGKSVMRHSGRRPKAEVARCVA